MKSNHKPDLARLQEELDYAVDFKIRNVHHGKWPAAGRGGGGFSFEKFDLLSNHPDFRRIDLLATGRNPILNEPLVRIFQPMTRIDVFLLADFSLSLACGFSESKIFQIAKLSTLFGYTAFRFGDRFGFLAFDTRPLEDFYHPPVQSRTIGWEIGEQILDFQPSRPFRGHPLDLENYLPEKKSLVIFISDYYFEPKDLQGILRSLRRHRILPIILRQEKERRWPSGLFGLLTLKDSETNREKMVFFSRKTIRDFEKKTRENEEEIRRIFHSLSVPPILAEDINPDRLAEELTGERE